MIARAETLIAGLRQLASEPAALPFRFSGTAFNSGLLQFFPETLDRSLGCVALAKPFARLLGGTWTMEGDKWESATVTYPGLEGVNVVIHYVVRTKIPADVVDLGDEPVVAAKEDEGGDEDFDREPDYDAPKPLTPTENYFQNDEHHVR